MGGVRISDLPTFSVVICTRNRPDELDKCLASVAALRHPRFEVLVIDNAPGAMRARELAHLWNAVYVAEPTPGLSRARNCGVRSSRGTFIAFLDDDAVADPEWLSGLEHEFSDPSVMAVVGRTFPRAIHHDCERLFLRMGGFDRGNALRQVFDSRTPLWFELANFGGLGSGTNMAFRRKAFGFWPGFDSRLGLGGIIGGNEEHHAFFSLLDRGFRVVYTPSAVVHHPFPATWREFRSRQLHTLACGLGYFAFLFREEPRYRAKLLRFALTRLLAKIQSWRDLPHDYRDLVPIWRQLPPMIWTAVRSLTTRRYAT